MEEVNEKIDLIEYVGNTIYFTSSIKEKNKQFKAILRWKENNKPFYEFKQVPFDYKKYFNHLTQGKTKVFNNLEEKSLFKISFIDYIKDKTKNKYSSNESDKDDLFSENNLSR